MVEEHEGCTQTTVRPVSHAGLGVHLLLFWEAPLLRMGPEATWVLPPVAIYLLMCFRFWFLCTWVPFALSICMFATVCLLDPLSVKSLILTVRLRSCLTTGCLDQISLESDYSCVFKGFALLFSKSWIVQWFSRVDSSGFIWP